MPLFGERANTGGFETITSVLAHAMWLLVRHPDQLALLQADPTLMRGFVEESLRIESPVQGQPRITTRDTEVGGVAIPRGTTPHYLPGESLLPGLNPKMPDRFGTPYQARLGGPETMYPEYIAKMKSMPRLVAPPGTGGRGGQGGQGGQQQ